MSLARCEMKWIKSTLFIRLCDTRHTQQYDEPNDAVVVVSRRLRREKVLLCVFVDVLLKVALEGKAFDDCGEVIVVCIIVIDFCGVDQCEKDGRSGVRDGRCIDGLVQRRGGAREAYVGGGETKGKNVVVRRRHERRTRDDDDDESSGRGWVVSRDVE